MIKTIQHTLALALFVSFSCEKPDAVTTALQVTPFTSGVQSVAQTLQITPVTEEAQFVKREGHGSVTFKNKIWVTGGYEGIGGNARNDIWYSKDGALWKQSLASKHFSPRTSHTTTVFKDKIWVIGGNEISNRKNDVWRSKDGMFWQEVTAKASFSKRSSHTTVVFDNKLWVIGGLDQDKKAKNDVWYSKDGAQWIQATANASFSPRFEHTSFVYAGKIWVVGGKEGIGFSNKFSVKSDIWCSKNGMDWIQVTTDAAFLPRSGHTSPVYDNKIWVIGGADTESNKMADAWYSEDGKSWKLALKHIALNRAAHTTVVQNKKMWVVAGIENQTKNDVWVVHY
ncbi:MAG: hypothetical protein AAF717_14935 [Bacteroidota bacterium]